MRPNFFVNTPDINPVFLQTSGRPGFRIRAVLAATLSPVYGIYSGFELCEGDADSRQGGVSQLREVRDQGLGLGPARATSATTSRCSTASGARIRRCRQFTNLEFYNAWNDQILSTAR